MIKAVWVLLAVLAGVVAVRLGGSVAGGDSWVTAPVLGSFPWIVAVSLVLVVLLGGATLRGRPNWRGPTVVAALVAVTGAAVIAPRVLAAPQPPAAGEVVTVAVLNARIGQAEPVDVVSLVESADVGLLAVVELTTAADAALRSAGITEQFPTVAVEDVPTPSGGVYATGDLVPLRPGPPAGGTPDVLWRTPGGSTLEVTTVHAAAPVGPEATRRWRSGLARTPPPGDEPGIVIGDFNATLDHAAMRSLLDLGWRDAAAEVGEGLQVTYDGLVDSSPALPMTIDHVLVSPGVAVRGVCTHDVVGTDHRMVVAELQLP